MPPSGLVLQHAGFLSDIRVWSPDMKTSARRWLGNFKDDEQDHAAALLEAFIFLSDELVDRLFLAAFDSLAVEVTPQVQDYEARATAWVSFLDQVLVSHPTGEMPNATDSGYAFDRKARQRLQIPEAHIMAPDQLVATAAAKLPQVPVVFVDDFVGSGDQFTKTWHRKYATSSGPLSLDDLAGASPGAYFYCPLVCTSAGLAVIEANCPGVRVRPTHLLPEAYSVVHPASLVWPDNLRTSSRAFLDAVNSRAGISSSRMLGYKDLALTLAFEHGVPDATLPLFYWEENGWVPLVRLR